MSILKGAPQTVNYLSFDGNNDRVDYTSLSSSSSFFEIEIHVKLNDLSSFQFLHENDQIHNIFITNNKLRVEGRSQPSDSYYANEINFNLQTNTFYEIIAQFNYSNKTITTIINGNTISVENIPTWTTNTVNVGSLQSNIGVQNQILRFFNGEIYYFKIDNNIDSIEYLFDEGSGTTLNDSAGNNDGTIVGATWQTETVSPAIQNIYYGTNEVSKVYLGNELIFTTEVPIGTIYPYTVIQNTSYSKANGSQSSDVNWNITDKIDVLDSNITFSSIASFSNLHIWVNENYDGFYDGLGVSRYNSIGNNKGNITSPIFTFPSGTTQFALESYNGNAGILNDLPTIPLSIHSSNVLKTGHIIQKINLNNITDDNKSFTPSNPASTLLGFDFNYQGIKMYIAGNDSNVYEYNLSTAFDISTISGIINTLNIPNNNNIYGVKIKPDGSKLYAVGFDDNKIYEYNLSTSFDISTSTLNSTFDFSPQNTGAVGVDFSNVGDKMYITFRDSGTYQYDLSSNFNISSASYNNVFLPRPSSNRIGQVRLTNDGTQAMFFEDNTYDLLLYNLTNPFDISTATLVDNQNKTINVNPRDIYLTPDDNKLLHFGTTIRQYDTGVL